MKEKKELLKNAVSLVRVKIEIEPLKSLSFLPVSQTGGADSSVILMDSAMFEVLRNYLRGLTVLVVPVRKEIVPLEEVEVYNL
jgi:hypothetical protein